jgi:aryl-alcohol dehydrogenase
MKARAAIIRASSGVFSMEEIELNEPLGDEVLVRVVATGICQTDAHVRNGHIPAPLPIVLGHEGAGVVERVGPAVTTLRPGDHVVLTYMSCGHCPQCLRAHAAYCSKALAANFSGARLDGTRGLRRPDSNEPVFGHFFGQSSFSTYSLASERNAVKVDKRARLELLGPLGCSLQTGAGAILNSFNVRPGGSVAVLGVGAVGFGALMAARLVGASTIIAVDINPKRLALAEELGATHTLNPQRADIGAAIKDITRTGVDYVFDTTGRADMLDHAVASLAPMGQVGLVAGGGDLKVEVAKLAFGMSVSGIVQGDANSQLFIPMLVQHHLAGNFPIDRLVRFYEFDDIDAAFEDSARGETIKPVLRIAATS